MESHRQRPTEDRLLLTVTNLHRQLEDLEITSRKDCALHNIFSEQRHGAINQWTCLTISCAEDTEDEGWRRKMEESRHSWTKMLQRVSELYLLRTPHLNGRAQLCTSSLPIHYPLAHMHYSARYAFPGCLWGQIYWLKHFDSITSLKLSFKARSFFTHVFLDSLRSIRLPFICFGEQCS